jgi:hypothetical protein
MTLVCFKRMSFGKPTDMPDQIVIADTSSIARGRLTDVQNAAAELADFVETNEPRILTYKVYVDAPGMRMTVLQIHPDAESAEFHMEIAAPVFKKFAGLLTLTALDVFGDASSALLAQLERKAEMLGGVPVVRHQNPIGFTRIPLQ